MIIQTQATPSRPVVRAFSQNSGMEGNASPAPTSDSVTLGSSEFGNKAIIVGCGFVPVLGAATNLMTAWATAWSDGDGNKSTGRPTIGLAGAVANLAGTAVGAYGLIAGNSTATNVGLGLIAGSGVAAGAVVALTR